jgi:hypothetical protein
MCLSAETSPRGRDLLAARREEGVEFVITHNIPEYAPKR